ncbi:hypothetical protein [Mesorhizobium sp. WSM4906]|uniref:hypothetical protein n=1 Tax=Mesorhizobium sp. WSM4906 TaxID=3038546 RepID=UPI002415E7BF|nr:hypothetical protein [Mesorhizobium sp. WSM4906]WFP74523.1 hypothetical protein QAZ22_22625 [Mesorhizobium sp. WSM4906]
MAELLNLSFTIQIVLVSGFFAYKTSVIGKVSTDSTEDVLFKVLSYGAVGKVIAFILAELWRIQGFGWSLDGTNYDIALSATTMASAIFAAMMWRLYVSRLYSQFMQYYGVYRDDHEPSVWNSITGASALWDCVHIHLEDGKVLESHFPKLDANRPLPGVVLNEDGVSLYVTTIHRPDGTSAEFEQGINSGFETITYVPRDRIQRMEISWKVHPKRRS